MITGLAQATTITIGPGANYDFDTIQAGIDAAVDGDTVVVALGEYLITESITFRGKAITVKSVTGLEQTTIRMGTPTDTNRGSVVVFENSETAASILDGFTITGGTGCRLWAPNESAFFWLGGGICLDNASSGTLRNCAIIQNSADAGGGVSVFSGSSAILTNCVISGNLARHSEAVAGGVLCWDSSSVTMIECLIRDNSTMGAGGGVCCGSHDKSMTSSVNMTNCDIMNNTAARLGGGVYAINTSATLKNCVFEQNTGGWGGGGVGSSYQMESFIEVSNCTITKNSGAADAGGGGVLSAIGSTTITNSIIYGNTSAKGPEISLVQGGKLSIAYSNVAGGQNRVNIEGGSTLDWDSGNIDLDPLFANPGYWADVNDANIIVEPNDPNAIWIDGDYHLKSEGERWDPVSESWIVDDVTSPCIDAGDPNSPVGDEPEPNGGRINMGAYGGTAEASMSPGAEQIVYVQWLGHSTVKVWTEDCIVYVDPERVPESLHDATLVCVTHTHGDHYSPSDIAKVSNAETQFIAPPDVIQRYGSGQTIAPGQTIEFDYVNIMAVPSYNTNKPNHPRSNNWVGYVVELAGKRVYVAGDTDLIEEMKTLGDINVAFLPAGGTYTMNATEAAEATGYIKPDLAIPYHWGQSVGTLSDAQRFVELAHCPAMVLTVGEMISSDNWPEYSPLIAHWAFDEAEDNIAHNSVSENHIALFGEPIWQPESGKIGGALQLDGINDYGISDFVLDPANGPFSVFAWVKDGAAGQVIIDQFDGTGSGEMWLGTEELLGKLMTGLVPPPAGRFVAQPLVSESVITDGQWHHIGFVWDGSYRFLYVDGTEVAKDTAAQNPLKSADGGLYIGAGKALDAATFFSGRIDDVRVYNLALSAEEIAALAK